MEQSQVDVWEAFVDGRASFAPGQQQTVLYALHSATTLVVGGTAEAGSAAGDRMLH
jgi:hypothetical protein